MKSIAPFNPPRISVAMLRSPASADSEFGNGKNLSARATESAFGSARPTLAQLMVTILLPRSWQWQAASSGLQDLVAVVADLADLLSALAEDVAFIDVPP